MSVEGPPAIFVVAFVAVAVFNVIGFAIGGWRAERRFRGQPRQPIVFRERFASGYSKKSWITELAGARNALDVIVTDRELWIKGILAPFSYVGTKFDLTHRVLLSKIRGVAVDGGNVELFFENESGRESHVLLNLRDPKSFAAALAANPPLRPPAEKRVG
jgi:hypothetical protein